LEKNLEKNWRKTSKIVYKKKFCSFQMASTNKYDRQLRLWGRNGQKALVESKLLLLGASCTGSETLKNLVLPVSLKKKKFFKLQ
jgi:hypothetical protein